MGRRKGYDSDLTNEQWELIEPFVERKGKMGCPSIYSLRDIVNAILYVTKTGIPWRSLPNDFPKYVTVYYHFKKWNADGTFEKMNEVLRQKVRILSKKKQIQRLE
jgi:putative transposase